MLTSIALYNLSALFYAAALFQFALNLGIKSERIRQIATTVVASGFLIQTLGMTFRWIEAGLIEVEAYIQGAGEILEGYAYWQVLTQHPPWSNLYEIMGYMAWGLVLVFLVCEIQWRSPLLGIFSLLLALTALGIAAFYAGPIKPLVPALKSWWIMIHVISASIAYASGTVAAIASFLYLVKTQNPGSEPRLRRGVLGTSMAVILVLGRGFTLFSTQVYQVEQTAVPGVGWMMITYLALASAGILLNKSMARYAYFLALADLLTILALLSLHSPIHVWDLALLAIMALGQCFVGLSLLFPKDLDRLLPSVRQLDHIAYSNVLVAFALVAIVLVTGALWAHYAWGRYWGWDPKETGALVIWITYALYLHSRIAYGWSKSRSAVIAVFGFFVILAGFLGVNLGWFADGLHGYGRS